MRRDADIADCCAIGRIFVVGFILFCSTEGA